MDDPGLNDSDRNVAVSQSLAAAADRAGQAVVATRGALLALEVGSKAAGGEHDVTDELLEPLIARTRRLHVEARELGRRVGLARRELPRRVPDARPRRVEPPGAGAPAQRAASSPKPAAEPSAGVRVLISQMTNDGQGRLEIERWLREEVGVEDAGRIVAGVLDHDA